MIDIKDLIPHRGPMLLVDRVIEIDLKANTMEASKTVRADEYFLQGHYPDFKIVPGVITCEMIFQTGAALIASILGDSAQNLRESVPVITRTNNTRFKQMIFPDDEVHLKVELVETLAGAFYMKGRALVNNKLAASVEFTCMMAPRPQAERIAIEDPARI